MALIVDIKVVPGSKNPKIILDKSGLIAVHVKSPPVDGKANKECVKALSDALQLKQVDIEIVSGLSSRRKRIKIHKPLTMQDIMHKLGLDVQSKLI